MVSHDQTLSSRHRIGLKFDEGSRGAIYEALATRFNARVAIEESLFSEEYLKTAFRPEVRL
jgi:hypothetical protein